MHVQAYRGWEVSELKEQANGCLKRNTISEKQATNWSCNSGGKVGMEVWNDDPSYLQHALCVHSETMCRYHSFNIYILINCDPPPPPNIVKSEKHLSLAVPYSAIKGV